MPEPAGPVVVPAVVPTSAPSATAPEVPPSFLPPQASPVAFQTVVVRFTTEDCGNEEPARLGMQVKCDAASGGRCTVTSRCERLRRQGELTIVLTVVLPASAVPALLQQIASGSVEGVPPVATLTVDGVTQTPPPVATTAYLRARTVSSQVECVVEVEACTRLLGVGGFQVGARTLSCVCSSARVTGPMVVTVAPADGVNATQFGAAVASAFGTCVNVYAPPAANSTAGVFVVNVCLGGAAAGGKGSKKGLLGLLGLLGLIPLVVCLLCFCSLCLRRRRKAADVPFAVYHCTDAHAGTVMGPASIRG